ncbi:MAG: putative NBD/HSP70 family sugar kinase [Limisphaerales bacterium]|jgi:predicted NBD/HSP70 family sugar kinase
MNLNPRHVPELDPQFTPAVLWNREYRALAAADPKPFAIALERSDGTRSTFRTQVSAAPESVALNFTYAERLLKFLLWQKGGFRVHLGGDRALGERLATVYFATGDRAFDFRFMGEKAYGQSFEVIVCDYDEVPDSKESESTLGGHLDGCRIGFDLGGSDRKCAAVIDGKVVHSEEVEWSPYFEQDAAYHLQGIRDSLKTAAAHLPRVDAIGGSAAGVYVDSEVRVASLFRGIPEDQFATTARPIFKNLQKEWNVPFVVVNDGDVTALAGSMSFGENSFLGVAMGTAEAAGYINPAGRITSWLNELAFCPVDYRPGVGIDEWSGDAGCGVQYFSQQGIARLATLAGLEFAADVSLPDRLVEVQRLMKTGDPRARSIYESAGVWLGYTVAHYAEFYELRNLLALGRVTSGEGGELLIEKAQTVLRDEFPELAEQVQFRRPDEKFKRHGQAVAAASLPAL